MEDAVKNEARKFVRSAGALFFITTEENAPVPRVVSVQKLDDDFTVWIATNGASRKVRQISSNPNVALAVQKDAEICTILGSAEIVRDAAVRARFWKDDFVRMYPGGKDDPNFTIIKVTPKNVRYINMKKYGFEPKELV